MSHSELDHLTKAEELFNIGKLDEALELLEDLNQLEGLELQQKGYYQILKALILIYQGKHEEAIKLGEEMIKESQEYDEKLLSVDGLSLISYGLIGAEKYDEGLEKIEQAEMILKDISQISQKDLMEKKSRFFVAKGSIYFTKGNRDMGKKMIEQTLSMQKELGSTPEIIWAHIGMATIMSIVNTRFDLALEYIKKAMLLAEEMKFNHYWIGTCHLHFGIVYSAIGEIDLCLEHEMKSLKLFNEINNKQNVTTMLNNIGASYIMKESYDLALEYIEESLSLSNTNSMIVVCLSNLIYIALEKDNTKLAQQYFQRLENLYNQNKERNITGIYKGAKALILKKSPRIRDRAKAEELFKQLIDEEFPFIQIIQPLIQLIDLLLMELSITNNIEVIDEINDYITLLLDKAEKSHSFMILGETYILQAKLALLTLDLKGAQRLLAKAQEIAENYKLVRLARKISDEHDELLKQMTIWENMDKSDVSLPERLKLTGLNVQMENMVKKRAIVNPELSDEEPIHLLIVSEGGTLFFSQSFIEDQSFEDDLFGSFFTAINSFIAEKFSKGLDRASFGEYTLLMNSLSPFLMCYIYKGQSYSAQKRIRTFIDKIHNDKQVWDTFEKFYRVNQEIQMKDVPSLEPLIQEIFMEKII
jgi:tetratricopeptide (TPR) repeat protein